MSIKQYLKTMGATLLIVLIFAVAEKCGGMSLTDGLLTLLVYFNISDAARNNKKQ